MYSRIYAKLWASVAVRRNEVITGVGNDDNGRTGGLEHVLGRGARLLRVVGSERNPAGTS